MIHHVTFEFKAKKRILYHPKQRPVLNFFFFREYFETYEIFRSAQVAQYNSEKPRIKCVRSLGSRRWIILFIWLLFVTYNAFPTTPLTFSTRKTDNYRRIANGNLERSSVYGYNFTRSITECNF